MDHDRYQQSSISDDIEAGSRGGWNECYTGTRFYTFDPAPEDVSIADIAHSLALQCRYNGNSKRFYSVAEHSCLLSDFVREHGRDGGNTRRYDVPPRDSLTALLHDAAEAYIGDLIRPVKHRMPEFRALEAIVEHVVLPVYGLESDLPPWMRDLDSRILSDERAQVMLTQHNEWSTDELEPLDVWVNFWSPARGEFEFLRRFHELHNGMTGGWLGEAASRARAMTHGSRFWWH
jgi:5'-deoxynucleotidase YfbR-like HD superfamily hydrolase